MKPPSQRMISLLIGVRGHRVDRSISRAHRHVLAVDARELRAVLELAPARARRLVAGEQHGVARVRQRAHEVVQHAAAGRHAARRDDDRTARVDSCTSRDSGIDVMTFSFCGAERAEIAARRVLSDRAARSSLPTSRRRARPAACPVVSSTVGRHRAVDVDRAASGIALRFSSLCIQYSSSSTRPSANAGMITLPPRSIVRRMIAASTAPSSSALVHAIAVGGFDQQRRRPRHRRRDRAARAGR